MCRKGSRDKKNNRQQLKEIAKRGHSKGTFVEGGGGEGGGSLKSEQKRTEAREEEGGSSMCVHSLKKNAEIFKMKFYIYSPVFPIDYNSSMKY